MLQAAHVKVSKDLHVLADRSVSLLTQTESLGLHRKVHIPESENNTSQARGNRKKSEAEPLLAGGLAMAMARWRRLACGRGRQILYVLTGFEYY